MKLVGVLLYIRKFFCGMAWHLASFQWLLLHFAWEQPNNLKACHFYDDVREDSTLERTPLTSDVVISQDLAVTSPLRRSRARELF